MKKLVLFLLTAFCATAMSAQTITAVNAPFEVGDSLVFDYTTTSFAPTDWIGIYSPGEVPDGDPGSYTWNYIPTANGQLKLASLPNGEYVAHLLCCDGYQILASVSFYITGTPAATIAPAIFAKVDSSLTFSFSGGTGSPTDWIGIYRPNDVPGTDLYLVYEYVTSTSGTHTIEQPTPVLVAGDYVARFLCCDSYNELANVPFTIYENTAPSLTSGGPLAANQPVIFDFTGGTGSLTDWVGIYKAGETPGGPSSTTYLYTNAVNGSVSFSPANLEPGVKYDAHLLCCDGYDILASYLNFELTPVSTNELPWSSTLFSAKPMPAESMVRLVFENATNGTLNLFNVAGQLVRTQTVTAAQVVELNNLEAGMYIARFQGESTQQSMRVVVR